MRLFLIGILIFILAEIGILIWVGSKIGVFWVLLLIILTAMLGIIFSRRQGFQTWNRSINAIGQREAPARAFIDGICIFLGAALLILPGFISDMIGLLLLIPFSRNLFKLSIAKMLDKMVNRGTIIYRRF